MLNIKKKSCKYQLLPKSQGKVLSVNKIIK